MHTSQIHHTEPLGYVLATEGLLNPFEVCTGGHGRTLFKGYMVARQNKLSASETVC